MEKKEINGSQEIKNKLLEFEKNFNGKNLSNILEYEKVIKNSKIIQNNKELELLFDAISSKTSLSLKLIYSSELYGEDIKKLKSAYIGVNDIIIIIQTKKNKRFGGYVHECFEEKEFQKRDKKAFLFNLDKLEIYKSKGTEHTIWNYNFDSIDFGYGTDLRIFHNFLTNENYTNPSSFTSNECDFEYNNVKYALNGEKFFNVLYLEIYKVNFN